MEFEAKLEERWPGLLEPKPPATPDQIRYVEEMLDAPLPDDVVAFFEMHNGCVRYPFNHVQLALPESSQELVQGVATPGPGSPFDQRRALSVLMDTGACYLQIPLVGEHRGELFRTHGSLETQYNCRAATSLTGLFTDWLYYLDNDFFALSTDGYRELWVRDTGFVEIEGLPLWDVLMEAWPNASPASLNTTHAISAKDQELLLRLQRESGIDNPVEGAFDEQIEAELIEWFNRTI